MKIKPKCVCNRDVVFTLLPCQKVLGDRAELIKLQDQTRAQAKAGRSIHTRVTPMDRDLGEGQQGMVPKFEGFDGPCLLPQYFGFRNSIIRNVKNCSHWQSRELQRSEGLKVLLLHF